MGGWVLVTSWNVGFNNLNQNNLCISEHWHDIHLLSIIHFAKIENNWGSNIDPCGISLHFPNPRTWSHLQNQIKVHVTDKILH